MSVNEIQKLREETGAGVMECKHALDEARGDFEKAIEIIKASGLAKAEKRMGRETGAGLVYAYVHQERVGSLVEVRSETDFVAHSEPFRDLVKNLAMHICAMNPQGKDELMAQPYVKDSGKTIKDLVDEVAAKTGENIQIGKFYRLEL